ncbi:MAG: LLM class flavin-dependent oxidoreductase [Chloroflexota bacterium]|nr:LLM class flavin-dependent oxidoreductase [Dehalococcoidia bacterium]MDW8253441.1 LLM class flavin-dependent oxidoreductase [Chloroflexota bacterium]
MARLVLSRAVARDSREWQQWCARADAAGRGGVAVADTAGADCFVDAALAAAVTERIPVRVLIALPVRSPLQTATAAASLLTVTGRGRFTLGLGPGSEPVIEEGHGGVFAPPLARLRDYAAAVAALLRSPAGEPVRYVGRFFRAAGVGYGLSPRDLPIVLAASGPQMVRLACAHGDGLALHLLTARSVLQQRAALARSLRPEEFPISAGMLTSVHDDLDEAMRRARLELTAGLAIPRFLPRLAELSGQQLAAEFSRAVREGRYRDAAQLLDDSIVRQFVIVCRPRDLAAAVESFDFVDTLSPVPVGQFALAVPALGFAPEEWRESQARVAAAVVGS